VAIWAQGTGSGLIQLLKRRTKYAMHWDALGPTAKVVLKEDPESESKSLRICIRPSHLCDALWIQLAQAIDGSDTIRTCIECKKWFTIKSGQGPTKSIAQTLARCALTGNAKPNPLKNEPRGKDSEVSMSVRKRIWPTKDGEVPEVNSKGEGNEVPASY
jgi:hypothetical protein